MGMFILLGLMVYIAVAVLVFILIYKFVQIFKNKILSIFVNSLVLSILILIPTYDIVITNILSSYYCSQEPNPKTFIKKKVEFPESIYWEDNVYPGFSKEDRELMIKNYLDGIHLKIMALNGDDNKVYVYTKTVPQQKYDEMINKISLKYKEIKKLETYPKEKRDEAYDKKRKKLYKEKNSFQKDLKELIKSYQVKEQIFTKQTMPKLNYTVTFNEVKLNSFASKFLYSDETKITQNSTNEVIAYNQRYMRFFYNIFPDIALGNRYYAQKSLCGDRWYGFDENILIGKWRLNSFGYSHHKTSPNKYLYKKYIKGEK